MEKNFVSAEEFLQHRYTLPTPAPSLPLPDEPDIDLKTLEKPYSNITVDAINAVEAGNSSFYIPLTASDWLNKSQLIRVHHALVLYEISKVFGSVREHPLDEILADAIGQIAAFGDFRAERQKLFFGLDGDRCDGRLKNYCQTVAPEERPKVYRAVGKALDILEDEVNATRNYFDRFRLLACRSIEETLHKTPRTSRKKFAARKYFWGVVA